MKKLMIVVAVAMAAVAVNAASFTWKTENYTNVLNPDGSAVTTEAGYSSLMAGGDIVLVLLDSTALYSDTSKMSVLSGNSGDTAVFKATGGATIKYGLSTTFMFSQESGVLKNGDKIGVMYQAADGTLSQLILTDTTGANLGSIDAVYTISGLEDDTWSGNAFAFTDAGTSANKNYITTAAVPEPTSGLLLLLGMAGLALRRKQA